MVKLVNRAKMTTATTGTGTITLGLAVDGFQSFASAGVANADVVRYVIEDGTNWEIGTGTYTSSGTTLSRTVSESSASGSPISLTGNAVVFLSATSADIQSNVNITGGAVNGTTIGATTASTGSFTTLLASTSLTTPLVTNAGTLALSATGSNAITASTNGVERLRVGAAGFVGIGTSSPASRLTVSAGSADGVFVVDNNNSNAAPFVKVQGKRSDQNSSQCFSGKLLLEGHRTDAAVANNKRLGAVAFGGNHTDGTAANILYPASISGIAEGTFSDATTMPTGLAFYTGATGRADTAANVDFGTERVRITNTGNVGIGTSSPATILDVNGDVTVSDRIIHSGDTNTQIRFPADDTVTVETNGSERMRVTSAGNVGIGTSSPTAFLEVARGSEGEYFRAGGDDAANARGLAFSSSTISGFLGAVHTINARSSVGVIALATNSIERMRITSAGNVGIGTAAPATALDVNGTVTATAFAGSGASLTGVVTTTGDQSVAGVKTFTDAIAVTGTAKDAGRFYGGTTDPTNTTRLNYDGNLHAQSIASSGPLTDGFTATADNDGTFASGTYTPTPVGGNFKTIVNNGAFTFAAPTASGDYTLLVLVTNDSSAGAITLSGFTKVAGNAFTTTNTNRFLCSISKVSTATFINVAALQ